MEDSTNQNTLIMWQKLFDYLMKQGLGILVLCGAVYYGHLQISKLELKIDACNEEKFQLLANQNAQVVQALDNNTRVLQSLQTSIFSQSNPKKR